MMVEKHKITPAIYVIMEQANQVLLLRRQNTGYQDGNYGLPSGHLEPGELPLQCAAREVKEEVGVDIMTPEFVSAVYNTTGGNEYICLFFKVNSWKGQITNCEPEKCDEIRWFGLNALPVNITPEVNTALRNFNKNKYYSEI